LTSKIDPMPTTSITGPALALLALALVPAPASAQLTADQAVTVEYHTGQLYVFDATTLSIVSSVSIGSDAIDVAVTSDGTQALVASFGAARLTYVDLTVSPPVVTGYTPIPFASEDISICCASGGYAVITDGGLETRAVSVDLATRTIVNTLELSLYVQANAVSPDGSLVLMTSYPNSLVRVCELSPAGVLTDTGVNVSVGLAAINVTFSPDGRRALVARTNGSVSVLGIDGSTVTFLGFRQGVSGGQSVAYSPAGDRAYVSSCSSGTIAVLNIDASGFPTLGGTMVQPSFAPCYYGVDQLAVSPDGTRLFTRNTSGLTTFDTTTNTQLMHTPLPGTGSGGVATLCMGGHAAAGLAFETHPEATEVQFATWTPFTVRVNDDHGDVYTEASEPITVSVFSGTGMLSGTTVKVPTGGYATFDDLVYDTAESLTLLVTSPELPALGAVVTVTPANSDLRITAAGIGVLPSGPSLEVGEVTTLRAHVINAGSAQATANVAFWRGDPDIPEVNAQFLGSASGTVPLGGTADFDLFWLPTVEGLQSLFVIVENTTPGGADSTPDDNRASRQVAVGAAEQELQVAVGEQTAWPGATSSIAITITNIGWGPATITGASFGPPSWLTEETAVVGRTLAPGESVLALAELEVPLGTAGGPLNGAPVAYALPIEFHTASGSFATSLTVKVFDQAASNVTVQVVDDASSAPLANALVAAQGLSGSFVTDGSGRVTLQLPPGPVGLFAYRTGYVAAAGTFEVPLGASDIEIRLAAGQTLAVAQVISEPLGTQEILDRGVDVSDPVNNTIYDFVVALQIGPPLVLRNVELPIVQPTSGSVTFSGVSYLPDGGGGGSGGGGGYGGGGAIITGRFDYNAFGRTETWIVIPGEVWALKQFFEVKTYVFNNAAAPNPEDVQLRDVTADLDLPPGIGLPELDGSPQQLTQSLPDLDAQEGAEAVWVIRGDLPGSYGLNGLVTADLFAFQAFQTALAALAVSDPFEVTLPRLRCEFLTPGQVLAGAAFDFGVLVTNEASAPAQLVRVILEQANLVHCTLAGTEPLQSPAVTFDYDGGGAVLRATYTLGDIAPGESGLALFKLVSDVSGSVVQVEAVSGCSSAPSPGVEVVPEPPVLVDQPDPVTACLGSIATFEVTATGFSPLVYQWRKDGLDLPGETGTVLYVNSVEASDAGSYDVVVSNPGGVTFSDAALLVVDVPAAIAVPLSSLVSPAGEDVVFSVSVSGSPQPTIQWLKDGLAIPGETADTLTLADVSYPDGGTYTVVVSNPCATVESSAVLTVNQAPVITCNAMLELWSPNHELVDVSSAFTVTDPDGDAVTFEVRCFSDEREIPDTGDGTGRHAPDFKDEQGGRGLLVRSERRGTEDGRWYVLVIVADDGRGGITSVACGVAACPHSQDSSSMAAVVGQMLGAQASIQAALDLETPVPLPLGGHVEHGLSGELGPFQ
jgi:hypothetical protein